MANYAYVNENKIEGLYDSLPQNWKNISNFCVLTDEEIQPLGWQKITKPSVEFDPQTQYLSDPDYYILGDRVYERVTVLQIPTISPPAPEEIALKLQIQWDEVRRLRDEKMNEFEWRYSRYDRYIRLGLEPLDSLENMDNYMQALADITKQEDPFNLIWPEYVG